jgi:L-lactate dehydrogenase complex protein LldE
MGELIGFVHFSLGHLCLAAEFSAFVVRQPLVLRSVEVWTISGPMAKVALFIPCFVDQLAPEVGMDMVHVLRRLGFEMEFPEEQTCCGQPAFNSGYWNQARPVAERFVQIFHNAEQVVCPSGSCTTMIRNFYPELLAGTPLHEEAIRVGRRVFEFSEFLVKVAKVTEVGASFPHRVAVHDSCHALRELHLKQESRELLRQVRGLELVEMPYSEDCCGFGGTFATKFGAISAAMGDVKAGNAESSGAEFVTATDPSCLLHLDGILRRRGSKLRTIHLAGILAQTGSPAKRRPRPAAPQGTR